MIGSCETRRLDLLLVEDSEDDVVLTRAALDKMPWPIRLHVVSDGQAALQFLLRQGAFTAAPSPDLPARW
jgi:CheY-like chemotaxis protein